MKVFQRSHHSILAIVILTSVIAFRSATLASHVISNIGTLMLLNQSRIANKASDGNQAPSTLFGSPETWLLTATELDTANQSAWHHLGSIFENQTEHTKALDAWRRGGMTVQEFITRGGRYPNQHNDLEYALYWYQLATEYDPDSSDAWFHLGWTQAESHHWQDALVSFDSAIRLSQSNHPSVGLSVLYYHKAMVNQWLQSPPDLLSALQSFESAIRLDDFSVMWDKADSYTRLGQILQWQNGDVDRQIDAFQAATATDPSYPTPYVLLGYAYYLRDHNIRLAEKEISKALSLVPNYLAAYWYLGEIYRTEGMRKKAIEMYQKVLEIDPNYEAAWHQLTSLEKPY